MGLKEVFLMTISEKLHAEVRSRYANDEEMDRAMKELSEMRFEDDPIPAAKPAKIVKRVRSDAGSGAPADTHALKVCIAATFWGILFLAFYTGGPEMFKPFVDPVDFHRSGLFYRAAAFAAMVVCGANALACIVIGRKKNANLFMLFVSVSFFSLFIVLGLFGAVFSFFTGQAMAPDRKRF